MASTSSGESGDRDQLKLTDMSCISSKRYEKSHPRQNAITEGIVKMIIKDLQPAYAVERKEFQELIALLEQGSTFNKSYYLHTEWLQTMVLI